MASAARIGRTGSKQGWPLGGRSSSLVSSSALTQDSVSQKNPLLSWPGALTVSVGVPASEAYGFLIYLPTKPKHNGETVLPQRKLEFFGKRKAKE